MLGKIELLDPTAWWGLLKDAVTSVGGTWPYLPEPLRFWWKFVVPTALALVFLSLLLSLGFRQFHPDRAAIEERGQREGRALALREDGFTVVSRDDEVILLARPAEQASPGFLGAVYPHALLVDDQQVRFDVIIIYDRASWRLNDSEHFEQENGTFINLENLFRDPAYKRTIGATRELICVGLASQSAPDRPVERDNELSERRATNLCQALHSSADGYAHEFWLVALGMATAVAGSDVDTRRQRTAIIIGIDSGPDFDVRRTLRHILTTTRVPGVDLTAYSRSNAPRVARYNPATAAQNWE